jgi:hypothetical protein
MNSEGKFSCFLQYILPYAGHGFRTVVLRLLLQDAFEGRTVFKNGQEDL